MPKVKAADLNNKTPVPAGDYILRIKKAEAKKAKTGAPMIALEFTVEDHPEKKVWANVVLSRAASRMAAHFFRCLHKHPESITSMVDLLGHKVWAKLGIKERQGDKRNEVVCYLDLPIPGPDDEPEEEGENDLFGS